MEVTGKVPEGMEAPPLIEVGILGTIVTGMLGIGTMRSVDKRNNVQTDSI
jgi:hypothetical protein